MDIDTSDWQEESQIEGDDPEDTQLLREMAAEARDYIEDFEWSPRITSIHLAFGLGGVVAAFLFQFDEVIEDSDDALWVVVGDLPSAYVIVEPGDDGISALSRYCEMMEDWAVNVLEGHSLDDSFPVDVEATQEQAEMLNQRIAFLRAEIIEAD